MGGQQLNRLGMSTMGHKVRLCCAPLGSRVSYIEDTVIVGEMVLQLKYVWLRSWAAPAEI